MSEPEKPDGGNRKGVGKVKMNLVFHDMAEALHEVCLVMTEGAKKHEPKGWMKVPNGIYEYTEALNRHLNAESRGELRDREWDLLHAAHAACCALIRTQLIINELKENGDVLPDGVVKKPLSEGVRKIIEEMMVKDEHPLRFKLNPESLPPGTTVTVTRPIGGSPEQAAPLKEFTPLPPEPTSWESLPALLPGVNHCTVKRYYVDRYVLQSDKSVKFYIRHDNGLMLTFTVKDACELMELGLVSQLANRIWRTYVSDADIAGWVMPKAPQAEPPVPSPAPLPTEDHPDPFVRAWVRAGCPGRSVREPPAGDTPEKCGACGNVIRGASKTYLAYDPIHTVRGVNGVMVVCESCGKYNPSLSVLGENTPERLADVQSAIRFASGQG